MAQVCPNCQHVHEGAVRHRCPNCRTPYDASLFDAPRAVPAAPSPAPEPPPPPPPPRAREPEPRRIPRVRPVEPRPPTPESKSSSRSSSKSSDPADHAPSGPRPLESKGVGETLGIEGFDIARWNIAQNSYHIELPDKRGEWRKLYSIVGTVKTPAFGRNIDTRLQEMRWLARKHVRFENTSRGLYVTPYDTLNGIYRMIKRPVELLPGARFRVGNFIMTYREPLELEPGEPRFLEEEQLLARDLKPLGMIEFLRPDGQPGVRFPLLKSSGVVLGRGGLDHEGREAHADLPLTGDPKVSPRHARLFWRGGEGEPPFLEDLGSKSGTWVQVVDRSPVANEDIFWLGELYLRVIEVH